MQKSFIFFIYLMTAISFVGYPQSGTGTDGVSEWAEIYKVTLDSYLKQNTALNEDIDFIAIDLSSLEFANDYDKKEIVAWFEKHYVPVIDTDFNGLVERGLYDKEIGYIPNGVLLRINKGFRGDMRLGFRRVGNEIMLYGSKYRGSEGANGFKTTWRLENGIWKFVETVMTWIS